MVYNYMPIRKIIKIVPTKRCASSKRERTPVSLSDCLDKEIQYTKNYNWRVILVITFTIILLYNMHVILNQDSNNIVSYYTKKFMQANVDLEALINDTLIYPKRNISVICRVNPLHTDNVTIIKIITNVSLESQYPIVLRGGYYLPEDCISRHKVAILVPYRNREKNLEVFLYNIHPFLMKQKLEYRIFVIEQNGTDAFNRGRVFNAGYQELKRFGEWRCVVFHDVDLLPLDERILYSCPTWPRHMCASIDVVTDPTFHTLFGGVSAMSSKHFEKVNGYSNLYWGWGGEDNDLFWRIRAIGFPIVRYSKSIARYTSLQHPRQLPNPLRYRLLNSAKTRFRRDGLTTLQYSLLSMKIHHLYTHIVVDINPFKENVEYIWLNRTFFPPLSWYAGNWFHYYIIIN